MVDRSPFASVSLSLFEASVTHNLQVLAGDGDLGGKFHDALGRSSDYGELRVVEAYADSRGQIVSIGCPAQRSHIDDDREPRRDHPGMRAAEALHGTSSHRTLFLVDMRTESPSIDVIVPTALEPEGRAVLWETTRRFRGPFRLAA